MSTRFHDLLAASHFVPLAHTKRKARSNAVDAKSPRRRAARTPDFNFQHLTPLPAPPDDARPTANRHRVDGGWDRAFARMRTGRPDASRKTVAAGWDAAIARATGRGAR
jgi:hypothetical protein